MILIESLPGRTERLRRRPASGRPGADGVRWLRSVVVLVCLAFFAVPIAVIVAVGFAPETIPVLIDGGIGIAAANSLVSAIGSGLIAVAFGTVLALLLDRTDLAGRRVLRLLLLSPMLVPPFVGAIAWLGVLGPQSPINTGWAHAFGAPLWNIYGGDGVVFLLTVHSYPIAYLIVGAALRRVPSDLEQAGRIAGASALRVMRDVTLPLITPAMLSSFVLIAVANLADFGIPSIVGLPERFDTLATLVYRYIQSGTVDDPLQLVSAIGIVLLVIAGLAVVLSRVVAPRTHELETGGVRTRPLALGRSGAPLAVIMWLVGVALTLLPLAALVEQALIKAPGIPLTWQNLSLDGFVQAVSAPSARVGIGYSIGLSLLSGLVCGVLGLVVGTLITRVRWRGNGFLGTLVMLPQAVPGLIIAVGWLLIAPHVGLFNTPWLIVCAYVMAFTGLVVQSVSAPLSATSHVLEEAARTSGASRLRALGDVSLRMAIPAALTGSVLVMLTAARELTISVLLVAPGKQTLGVAIFNLEQSGAWGAAASLSLLVTVAGLAGLGLAAPRRSHTTD